MAADAEAAVDIPKLQQEEDQRAAQLQQEKEREQAEAEKKKPKMRDFDDTAIIDGYIALPSMRFGG